MTSERDKIARLQLPTKAKTLDSRLRMSGMTKEGYYYRSFAVEKITVRAEGPGVARSRAAEGRPRSILTRFREIRGR